MSWLSLPAIVGVALAGALAFATFERAAAREPAGPRAALRHLTTELRRPLVRPWAIDAWLYHLAPPILLCSAVSALAMVPWTPHFRGLDFTTGVILYSAALAYVTPAVLMAGWGSGRPLSVTGGMRFLALMLAYEMPIVMAVTAAATPAESLRPADIVAVQHAVPMALAQPLAFALFAPAVMAVAYLPPFDLPQAEGELGGGAFAHYSGGHAVVLWLAQRVLAVGAAGMTVALFLGGWHGPVLPDAAWMALKTLGVMGAMVWIGHRLPRMEIDRLLSFAWKWAVPAAIVAIGWAGFVTLTFYR